MTLPVATVLLFEMAAQSANVHGLEADVQNRHQGNISFACMVDTAVRRLMPELTLEALKPL